MQFVQTSAKTGYNVDPAFIRVSGSILDRIDNGDININNNPIGIKVGMSKHTFETENGNKKIQKKNDNSKNCCNS